MRVERDKLVWLKPGPGLSENTPVSPRLTRAARWWITGALTGLDDTRTPAFQRLPFACTLVCLSQVVRAVEDWVRGFDERGERLSSEIEDLAIEINADLAASGLQPETASQIGRLCREVLEFISIRRMAADTRGPKQKRFTQIIFNEWRARSEEEAARLGPGRLASLASELLTALTTTDEYRARVQEALADALAGDAKSEEVRYCTYRFLRSMQILGCSTPWLQHRIGVASGLLAKGDHPDHLSILAKSFPTVRQDSSRYVGVVALEPLSNSEIELPRWMKPVEWQRVVSLVAELPEGSYKDQARWTFADSGQPMPEARQYFEIAHRDVRTVTATPWGRYTDQFDAAWDIAAAITSTLQNYWAGNPRRDLWMIRRMLVYVPNQFHSFVSLDWRQESEAYQVRGLYEPPPGIEPVFHWAHQSFEIPSPEAGFLCAWIAAEKLVARGHLRQSSMGSAPDAVMVEWLIPILVIEVIWSRLLGASVAIHELGIQLRPTPKSLIASLLQAEASTALIEQCEPVPYLADELRELSLRLRDAAVALAWLEAEAAQIRRNFHRMRRLRNQIVHNAELDPGAAGFLSEVLADYVRIAAYRIAVFVRSTTCPVDEAFGTYRRTYRELHAALQDGRRDQKVVWAPVIALW